MGDELTCLRALSYARFVTLLSQMLRLKIVSQTLAERKYSLNAYVLSIHIVSMTLIYIQTFYM